MFHFPTLTNVPEERLYQACIQGAAAADPVSVGAGLFSQGFKSITRLGAGRILFTWRDNPGVFVGTRGEMLADNAAQANVKGWTVTRGIYSNANGVFTLEIDVWNSAFAAADLAATSFLDITFVFKATQA